MTQVFLKFLAGDTPREVAERTFRFVASTNDVDRDGDVIDQAGWQLDNYRKNPVVLVAHHSAAMPVARARVWIEASKLMADVTFPTPGVSAESDQAYRLVKEGFLRALSVGFMPLEAKPQKDGTGWMFLKQDLYEISLVSVPANAHALLAARLGGKGGTRPETRYAIRRDSFDGGMSRAQAAAYLKSDKGRELVANGLASAIGQALIYHTGALDVEEAVKQAAKANPALLVSLKGLMVDAKLIGAIQAKSANQVERA